MSWYSHVVILFPDPAKIPRVFTLISSSDGSMYNRRVFFFFFGTSLGKFFEIETSPVNKLSRGPLRVCPAEIQIRNDKTVKTFGF